MFREYAYGERREREGRGGLEVEVEVVGPGRNTLNLFVWLSFGDGDAGVVRWWVGLVA